MDSVKNSQSWVTHGSPMMSHPAEKWWKSHFFLRMNGITGGNSSCILISMQVCGFVFSYFLFVVMHASLDSMLVVARVPLYLQKQDDVRKFPKLKSIVPFFPCFQCMGADIKGLYPKVRSVCICV